MADDLLRDEPGTPELAPYLPSLAAGLRDELVKARMKLAPAWAGEDDPRGLRRLDDDVAFLCAMDDDGLVRVFGRWLREDGVTRFLVDMEAPVYEGGADETEVPDGS